MTDGEVRNDMDIIHEVRSILRHVYLRWDLAARPIAFCSIRWPIWTRRSGVRER